MSPQSSDCLTFIHNLKPSDPSIFFRTLQDAAEMLTSLGYNVVNLKGGIIEWKEDGLPVVSEQEN